jgi:cell envelope opacity-associated protein A
MKLITLIALLIFTFNLQAQDTLVTIKPNDSKLASMQLEEPTLKKAIKKLKKIVLRSSWLKGEWQKPRNKTIFKRENNLDDTVDYYKPKNFTVIIEDVTDKKAADKKDKEDSKKEVKRLKARIEELEIDIDHKKLLKRLAKECLK